MRTKLALTLAFASFLLVTALGTALAGAEPLSEGSEVDPAATTTTTVPSLQAPACANGLDDDADGLIDSSDADCESPSDTVEAPPASAPAAPAEAEGEPVPAPAPAPSPGPDKKPGVKEGAGIDGGGAGSDEV
ncbi:MAG TPA: hypothetical protein VJU14_12820, partial [Solirubrobacterales bacterium]|nr:hypothetical protein [Solirubrobacterales bacterium]